LEVWIGILLTAGFLLDLQAISCYTLLKQTENKIQRAKLYNVINDDFLKSSGGKDSPKSALAIEKIETKKRKKCIYSVIQILLVFAMSNGKLKLTFDFLSHIGILNDRSQCI
jgi:hypothetical protein